MREWARRNAKTIWFFVVAIALIYVALQARYWDDLSFNGWYPFYNLKSFVLAGIVMAWWISIRRRIIRKDIRIYLEMAIGLILFFLLVRTMRYELFKRTPNISRYLWYLYYIAIILVPVFSLYVAEMVGQAEEAKLRPAYVVLLVIGGALTLLVMTNDFHQWAFAFSMPLGTEEANDHYTRGWVYYMAAGWAFSLTLFSIGILIRKSQIRRRKRMGWIPILTILLCCLTVFVLFWDQKAKRTGLQFTEILILGQLLIYEICIGLRLIPSNRGYDEYFLNSDVSAMIIDEDGVVNYASKQPIAISASLLEAALENLVFLNETTLVQAKRISGGEVVWTYDVSAIVGIMDELREMKETLSERKALLQAENELKEKQAHTIEMNRIYDRMLETVSPALSRLERSLDKIESGEVSYEEEIGSVAVIGAYVKRRCNLALITDGEDEVNIEELYLALDESIRYMKGAGMQVYLQKDAEGKMDASEAVAIYDTFEAAAEKALEGGGSLYVRVFREDNAVTMKLMSKEDELC